MVQPGRVGLVVQAAHAPHSPTESAILKYVLLDAPDRHTLRLLHIDMTDVQTNPGHLAAAVRVPVAGRARLARDVRRHHPFLTEDPAFGHYHVDELAVLYLPLTAHIRDLGLTRAAVCLSRDHHA